MKRLLPLFYLVAGLSAQAMLYTDAPKDQARAEILWVRPICVEPGRYVGWPSVCRLANGDLMAVFSGDRDRHVCPFGKVQMVRSSDEGETWSRPVTIADAPIDDRDAGIVQMPDGEIVVTYFTSLAYRSQKFLATDWAPGTEQHAWRQFDAKLTDDQRRAALGYWRISSVDNGRTWCAPEKIACAQTPHGPILLKDGSLFQIGRSFEKSALGVAEHGRTIISAWRSTDKGHTWECLCRELPDENGENAKDHQFHEPFAVELADGTLVAQIRYHGPDGCLRQSVSKDGGRTWSSMVKTPLKGLPPHLVRRANGQLVSVYGRRLKQYGCGEFAALSDDGGATWDVAHEISLAPHVDGDIGYPATCELANGDLLTVFYQPTEAGGRPALLAARWRIKDPPTPARPILVFNEDNSHFMRDVPAAEFVRYFDSVCRGAVTHFFMCPNCQRSNIDTQAIEPIWTSLNEPGITHVWGPTAKALHDKGIDPYRIWTKRAREKGVSPWLSIRMNEVHQADMPKSGLNCTLWREHPELRRVPTSNGKNWTEAAFDYAHAEVRARHVAYVGEVLDRYDVDGVEIDWLRFPDHLTPGLEPTLTNCLTEVMRGVRAAADRAAKKWGHPVKVAARVPTAEEICLKLGEDPVFWAKEKLIDWLIVCNFFATADFDIPYRAWRARLDAVKAAVTLVPGLDSGVVKDVRQRQLNTLAEYCGFCENLYAQGAPGVYVFNPFHFSPGSAEWEGILSGALAPDAVLNQPRAYPVAYRECAKNGAANGMQLPRKLNAPVTLLIPIGQPPKDGTAQVALAFDGPLAAMDQSRIRLNGAEPLRVEERPLQPFLSEKTPAKFALSFTYPLSALKAGANVVEIPALDAKRTVWACELFLAGGRTWSFAGDGEKRLKIPHDAAYAFPGGFKATVRFACDLGKISARPNHANLFCKGNDFQDGYCVMVRKDGALLVDIKGIRPAYHVVPLKLESRREYLLEVYVTPKVVRIFVDGVERGSYPYTGTFDFSNRHPLQLGSMGAYKFFGRLPLVKLEPLADVKLPPGGPGPLVTVAPKHQANAELLWTKPICYEKDRYIGWATAALTPDGTIVAAFSGDRDAHICPWGKTQVVRSTDGGETWSAPQTINNSIADDRDCGLVLTAENELLALWFTDHTWDQIDGFWTKNYPATDIRYQWRQHVTKLPKDLVRAACGLWSARSRDGGLTWSKPEKYAQPIAFSPHGPVRLKDGTLIQMGRTSYREKEMKGRTRVTCSRSTDHGRTWEELCYAIPDQNGENTPRGMFHEPHAIELKDGRLMALVRYHGEDNCLRQTFSRDGGRTWSPMAKTPMLGLPPHLLRLKDGRILCTFGRRFPQPTGFGEYACLSSDEGATWDAAHEIHLAAQCDGDLGYPTTVQLKTGELVTVYYQRPTPDEKPCLMATKWRLTK